MKPFSFTLIFMFLAMASTVGGIIFQMMVLSQIDASSQLWFVFFASLFLNALVSIINTSVKIERN